jgi:hypothetical protein
MAASVLWRSEFQKSGFDYRPYPFFWEVLGLEQGPLNIVSTIEELLERKKVRAPVYENREFGRRDPSCLPCNPFYPQKLVLTSPTSSGRSVGIVLSRTKATELLVVLLLLPSDSSNGYSTHSEVI